MGFCCVMAKLRQDAVHCKPKTTSKRYLVASVPLSSLLKTSGYGCHQIHPSVCMSHAGYSWVADGVECPDTQTPSTIPSLAASALALRVMVVHAAATELDTTRHGSGDAVELAAEVAGGGIPELCSSSSPRELDSTSKGVSLVDVVGHDVDD
ncbi:hypothetical protein V8C34DRAFT_289841 [Trichoderma compactum]